jgi:tetratricopeptide (TPR) repeat protein
MQKRNRLNIKLLIPILILSGIGIYFIPPVHARLAPRMDLVYAQIKYLINPPEEAVFQPQQQSQVDLAVTQMMQTHVASQTPRASLAPTTGPTLTPTVTSTPLPESVILPGITYVHQHNRWNYCGPANLTMALNFWGWEGDRDDVARVVKPGDGDPKKDFIQQGFPDKNVMPYELVDFVNEETEYRALYRYGGDMDLIKRLLVAGFPVVVEKGYYERDANGKIDWLGHYLFTTGYDDARGGFIAQDSYLKDKDDNPIGENIISEYEIYQDGWRNFNYLFIVVYPANRESDVLNVLGSWADPEWAAQHALEIAEEETAGLSGNNLFYAWFNKGTSHVALNQYVDAAIAYDEAFSLYESWDTTEQNRPYRMMWFQTGPYFAYYYSVRYQDVIDLADTTLNITISKPTLEESLLWRGRAYYMLGNTQAAVSDYRAALKVHVNWGPAVQALQDLGIQP